MKPPARLTELVDIYSESVKMGGTRTKTLGQLDPLIWPSFRIKLNMTDPQTMADMVTWDDKKWDFNRPLDRDFFLWDHVNVYFMHMGLVSTFIKDPSKHLRCPNPECTCVKVRSNGWARNLRRVCSSDGKPAFLKYSQHICPVCQSSSDGRKFNYNAYEFLDQLQPAALDFWNLIVTRKGVITSSLIDRITRAATKFQSFSDLSNELRELKSADFLCSMRKYYEVAAIRIRIEREKYIIDKREIFGGQRREVRQPQPYYDMKDAPGWTPCSNYLINMYILSRGAVLPGASHSQQEYDRLSMSLVGGSILKNDNNFVLTKFIRGSYKAVNTLMNEFGEVVGRYLVPTIAFSYLDSAFKLVTQRTVYQGPGVRVDLVTDAWPLIIYIVFFTNAPSHFFPTQALQPDTMFCDSPNQQGNYFRKIFGPWFLASGSVQDDALHIIQRYGRAVPDNHPMKSAL